MNGKTKFTYERYWHERIRKSMDDDKCGKKPNEIFATAFAALQGGDRILDIGCGDGTLYSYIKDKFRKIYGAEIADEAAHLAQKQGMFPSVMDVNMSLSYKDNTFDAISCLEVIEHLLNPCHLLSEMYRLLRPGGQLVLTTPNIRNFRNLNTLIFNGIFPHTSSDTFVWGGGHLHYFTRKDINALLNKAGFKKISFSINQEQFLLSKKRNLIHFLIGENTFGEWFCASITVTTYKEP